MADEEHELAGEMYRADEILGGDRGLTERQVAPALLGSEAWPDA